MSRPEPPRSPQLVALASSANSTTISTFNAQTNPNPERMTLTISRFVHQQRLQGMDEKGHDDATNTMNRRKDAMTNMNTAEHTINVTHAVADSPVGVLTITVADGAITGIYFPEHSHPPDPTRLGLRVQIDQAADAGADPAAISAFEMATTQLGEYFAGERTEFNLPLRPEGNAFQQKVWALLREIPYGQTRSYGDLAQQLGDPGLARAVGAANGRNPISIIVPCHRVVGANGNLVGYAGGLGIKRFLLALEESAESRAGKLF